MSSWRSWKFRRGIAASITSVVVPDVEHHMLARIDLQGDDESVCGIVPDRIVIRRRHKETLVWRARGQDSAHRVRGKCGRVNPSLNLGAKGSAKGTLAWGCVPDIHAEKHFIQQTQIYTIATGRPMDLE